MTAILWPKVEGGLPPQDVEYRLCALLRGRVDQAYLFGSFGTETFRAGSDIDLILVCETDLPFVERARPFLDFYGLFPRMDILVYTAEELEAQLRETVGFWA